MPNKTKLDKMLDGRQYRAFTDVAVKEEDEGRSVEGYATTFDVPYLLWRDGDYEVWEKVDKRAFDKTDMTDVIFQYNHEGRVFARQSNGTLSLNADDHGLHIVADLGGTEIGRQLYEEIKGGYTNKMSFGFRVNEDSRETLEEDGLIKITRTILGIEKLYDVSAVSLPANDATVISARNFCEGVIEEVRAERLKAEQRKAQIERIKKLTEVQFNERENN